MAFERVAGLPGKCYRPEGGGRRKHPCSDCFSCQFCSKERCALCRGGSCRGEGGETRGTPGAGADRGEGRGTLNPRAETQGERPRPDPGGGGFERGPRATVR